MAINVLEQSLKNKLDAANPNVVADGMRIVKFGSVLRALPTFLRLKVPAASAVHPVALHSVVLADDGKASSVFRATARNGGAINELTILGYGGTPGAGQIAVAPNGDLVTFAADAWLELDVTYLPEKYDLAELTLGVTAGVLTLPTPLTAIGAIFMLEAEITAVSAGAALGKKIVLAPDVIAPAVGQARLDLTKTSVLFAVADNATQARVKIAITPSVDLDALLTATSAVA